MTGRPRCGKVQLGGSRARVLFLASGRGSRDVAIGLGRDAEGQYSGRRNIKEAKPRLRAAINASGQSWSNNSDGDKAHRKTPQTTTSM